MSIFHIFNKREELKTIITDEETDGNNVPLISAEKIMQLGSYDTIELVISVEHTDARTVPEDGYILYEDEFLGWREYQIIKVTDIDEETATRSIYAELGSVELDDHKIQFDLFKETSAGGKLGELLDGTRYSVGYIDPSIKNYQVKFEELRHLSVLEGVFLLAKKYRCEVYFTYEVTGQSVISRKVNLITQLGTVTGKRFESDKDTTGIERVIDYTGIKTAIIPTGKLEKEDGGEDEELTISDVVWSKSKGDPADKPKGQNWLGDPQALSNWGRKSTSGDLIHRFTHIYFDIKDPKELISMAWVELGKYKNPKVTYTLKVVDLYRLTGKVEDKHEAVVLGDTVAVIDHHFPTPLIVQARVIKIEENMIDPTQSVITLGDVQQTYTSHAISKQEKQDSDINSVIKQAGKVMQSANGKTGTHIGAIVPKNPSLNDTWIRPHPEKPKETQWLLWDGSQWGIELDTSVATDAYEKTKDIDEELAKSKEEVKKVQGQIDKTLEKAESAEKKALEVAKNFGEVDGKISTIKKTAEDAKTEAVKSAQELAQVKKDAEEFSKDNEAFKKKTETQITAVQGEISGMVKKTEYDGLAQTVKSQGTSLSQTAEALKTKAEKSLVDNINKQVTTTSSEVKIMAGKVDSVVKTADANSVKISKQEQTAESLKTTISKVETDLKGIEVGGRNLLLDTASLKSNKGRAKISGELFNGNSVVESLPPLNASTYADTFTQMTTIAPKAKSYICTFWAKASKNGTVINNHFYSPSNTTKSINSQGKVTTSSDGQSSLSLSDKWEKYWIMWEQNESERQKWFLLGRVFKESNAVVYISSPALYEGTVLTDWAPAPEDMATVTELSTVEQTIKGLQTAVANKAEKSQITQLAGQVTSVIENSGQVNLLPNTDFLTDLSEWSGITKDWYRDTNVNSTYKGSYGVAINVKGLTSPLFNKFGSPMLPVDKSLKYSARVMCKAYADVPHDNANGFVLCLEFYDDKGTRVYFKETEYDKSKPFNEWQELKVEGAQCPANATKVKVTLIIRKNGHAVFSQPMLVANPTIGAYTSDGASSSRITQLSNQLTTTITSVKGVESKVTQLSEQYSIVINKQNEAQAQLNVLSTQISSTVQKGEIISSINQTAEKITIDARLIHITGQTVIDNASIKSSAIQSLSADKITTGTLNAKDVKIINLDVNSLVGNKTSFIQSAWNGISTSLSIDSFGMYSKRSDGSISAKYLTDGIQIWGSKSHIGGITFSGGTSSTEEGVVVLSRAGNYLSLGYQPKNLASNKYLAAITINGTSGNILVTTPMEFENTKIFGEKSIEGETYFSGDVNFQKGTTVAVDPDAVFALPKIYGLSYSDYYLKVHSGNFGEAKAMGFTNPSGSAGIMIASDGNVLIRKKSGAWTILG